MNAAKSKSGNAVKQVTKRTLLARCRAKGFATVGAFARHIQRARPVLYFALEKPTRYRPTYDLIQKELSQ